MRELYYVYSTTMSLANRGIFQLLKRVAWGIVPGLKLLLFYSQERSHFGIFQRVFMVYSAILQRSELRLTSTHSPIPNGVAYENFELMRDCFDGQRFIFWRSRTATDPVRADSAASRTSVVCGLRTSEQTGPIPSQSAQAPN